MSDPDRPEQADQVRRCARCGAGALVCVQAWQHRVAGLRTGSWTLDFACRSCGARVTLHPQQQIRVERLFAYVMLPAIFPSIFFFARARRKARAWSDNPVVSGASAAPLESGEPARACGVCPGLAQCTEIGRQQIQGIVSGTRRRYTCSRCGNDFTVHDDRAVVFSFVAATMLSAIGALLVAFPPGSAVGAEASNRWFGVALLAVAALAWVIVALRIRQRRAHPIA